MLLSLPLLMFSVRWAATAATLGATSGGRRLLTLQWPLWTRTARILRTPTPVSAALCRAVLCHAALLVGGLAGLAASTGVAVAGSALMFSRACKVRRAHHTSCAQ